MRNLGRQGLGDGKVLLKRTERLVGPNQEERKEKLNKVDATEQNVCASGSVKMFLQKTGRHLWDVHRTRLAARPRYTDGPQGN